MYVSDATGIDGLSTMLKEIDIGSSRHEQGFLLERVEVCFLHNPDSVYTIPDVGLSHRFGTLISQHNPECIRAVISVALFMKVSSPADTLFYGLLSSPSPDLSETSDTETTMTAIKSATDAIKASQPFQIEDSFAAWFIAENRRRLTDSATYMTQWFTDRGFKVYPANAGHFLWVDFADRVGWDTWAKELNGFHGLFERRVYIVSRVFCGAEPRVPSAAR